MGSSLKIMSITITENAAKHVNNHLANRGKGIGLRLGVKTTGCSGLAYVIEFADKVENIPENKRGLSDVFKAAVYKKPSLMLDVLKVFVGI